MIVTANHWFSTTCENWLKSQVLPMARRFGVTIGSITQEVQPQGLEIRQGNWLAICACNGAEYGWEEGFFVCLSCFNAAAGHKLLRTVFPAEREEIENILELRPLPNRNWRPGETLEDLRRENIDHGLGVRVSWPG